MNKDIPIVISDSDDETPSKKPPKLLSPFQKVLITDNNKSSPPFIYYVPINNVGAKGSSGKKQDKHLTQHNPSMIKLNQISSETVINSTPNIISTDVTTSSIHRQTQNDSFTYVDINEILKRSSEPQEESHVPNITSTKTTTTLSNTNNRETTQQLQPICFVPFQSSQPQEQSLLINPLKKYTVMSTKETTISSNTSSSTITQQSQILCTTTDNCTATCTKTTTMLSNTNKSATTQQLPQACNSIHFVPFQSSQSQERHLVTNTVTSIKTTNTLSIPSDTEMPHQILQLSQLQKQSQMINTTTERCMAPSTKTITTLTTANSIATAHQLHQSHNMTCSSPLVRVPTTANVINKSVLTINRNALFNVMHSLPPLNDNQYYIINLPDQTRIIFKPPIKDPNLISKNSSAILDTNNEVNPSTSSNQNLVKTIVERPKKIKEVKEINTNPRPYRCVQVKKNNFKMDMDGFTFFDRLGFFKAEEIRSKRCRNMLGIQIDVRARFILRLVQEYERKIEKRDAEEEIKKKERNIFEMKMLKKDVLKAQPIKAQAVKAQPSKTQIVNSQPVKGQSVKKQALKIRTVKSQIVRRRTVNAQVMHPKRLKKNKTIIYKGRRKKKRKQFRENVLYKKYQNYYKLKDCSILLSKDEVNNYFAQKPPRKCKQFKKRDLNQLSYHNNNRVSMQELFEIAPDALITFVDEGNFELIEDLHKLEEKIYFINSHETITGLYADIFPAFSRGLRSNQIKIVDKPIFDKFVELSVTKPELSTIQNIDIKNEQTEDQEKFDAFCNFMNGFHLARKNYQCDTVGVCSEHNYFIKQS